MRVFQEPVDTVAEGADSDYRELTSMKLIVAHLPQEAFGPVRTALHRLGVRTTFSEVRSCGSQPATTLNYRGTALQLHSRSELRLECLATAKQSRAVVSVLRDHADHAAASVAPVIVLDLEEHHRAGVPRRGVTSVINRGHQANGTRRALPE